MPRDTASLSAGLWAKVDNKRCFLFLASLSQPLWILGGIYGEGLFLGNYSLKNSIDELGPQTSCLGEAPWPGRCRAQLLSKSSLVPPPIVSLCLLSTVRCHSSDLRVQREEATLRFGVLVLIL